MAKKTGTDAVPEGTVTKAEAVRTALADGFETPAEGVAYIRDKFGLDVPNQMFSSYKAAAKKKDAGGSKGVRVGRPGRNGKPSDAAVLEVAGQVKTLVDKHGYPTVRACLDLFG